MSLGKAQLISVLHNISRYVTEPNWVYKTFERVKITKMGRGKIPTLPMHLDLDRVFLTRRGTPFKLCKSEKNSIVGSDRRYYSYVEKTILLFL